jgi:hypothetical protein
MTPRPSSDSVLTKVPTPLVGEWALRLKVSQNAVRPDYVITKGMTYADLNIDRAMKPEVDLYGDYILTQVTGIDGGYNDYWFGKAKTEDQATTPYKTETGNKHYDWPTVLHAVAFADDPEYPVTETRPGPRTVSVPRKRARAIVTESAFALCRTVTNYYLNTKPFDIPTHPQPVPAAVSWVVNNSETSLVCLHTDMDLPARGQTWNITEIAGEIEVVGNPSRTRNFPATPFTDWQPFVIADDQQELPTGHYRRITTILYPPTAAELSSL